MAASFEKYRFRLTGFILKDLLKNLSENAVMAMYTPLRIGVVHFSYGWSSRGGCPTSVFPPDSSYLMKCQNTTTSLRLRTVSLLSKEDVPTRGCAKYPPASALFRRSLQRSFH